MAKFSLWLHPEAELDLLNGFEWYAERNADAADAFAIAIERAGQLILRSPDTWPTHVYGRQKFRVGGFPYKLIFRVVEQEVQIIAVAHDRRRPNYWAHRLD